MGFASRCEKRWVEQLPHDHQQVEQTEGRQHSTKPRRVEHHVRGGWKTGQQHSPCPRPGNEEQEKTHVDQVAYVEDDSEESCQLHQIILTGAGLLIGSRVGKRISDFGFRIFHPNRPGFSRGGPNLKLEIRNRRCLVLTFNREITVGFTSAADAIGGERLRRRASR